MNTERDLAKLVVEDILTPALEALANVRRDLERLERELLASAALVDSHRDEGAGS